MSQWSGSFFILMKHSRWLRLLTDERRLTGRRMVHVLLYLHTSLSYCPFGFYQPAVRRDTGLAAAPEHQNTVKERKKKVFTREVTSLSVAELVL